MILYEIFRVVNVFPACYIAESRFPLGQFSAPDPGFDFRLQYQHNKDWYRVTVKELPPGNLLSRVYH